MNPEEYEARYRHSEQMRRYYLKHREERLAYQSEYNKKRRREKKMEEPIKYRKENATAMCLYLVKYAVVDDGGNVAKEIRMVATCDLAEARRIASDRSLLANFMRQIHEGGGCLGPSSYGVGEVWKVVDSTLSKPMYSYPLPWKEADR